MRVFSYVVKHDIGFAPNPFHGYCTLAACKPQIRRTAQIGDVIIGTGAASNRLRGKLVYAMRVSEISTFDQYWSDPRFLRKRPNLRGSKKLRFGDNIYHRGLSGNWIQEDSRHSRADGSLEPEHLRRDTELTERVLISDDFVYFGKDGPAIPDELRRSFDSDLVLAGRGYLCRFSAEHVEATVEWFNSLPRSVQGDPMEWRKRQNLAELRRAEQASLEGR